MQVEVTDQPTRDDVLAVDDGLSAFNAPHMPEGEERRLAVLVRDGEGRVAGGAVGRSWGRNCEVQILWVREDLRGRGHGARLMRAAEREAAARGCTRLHLSTLSFQAPAFYERLGYREVRRIEGFPRGICKHEYEKRLSEGR